LVNDKGHLHMTHYGSLSDPHTIVMKSCILIRLAPTLIEGMAIDSRVGGIHVQVGLPLDRRVGGIQLGWR